MGWQWYQLHHMQIICILLQTANHASTLSCHFYRPDALPAIQPTAWKHWRQTFCVYWKLPNQTTYPDVIPCKFFDIMQSNFTTQIQICFHILSIFCPTSVGILSDDTGVLSLNDAWRPKSRPRYLSRFPCSNITARRKQTWSKDAETSCVHRHYTVRVSSNFSVGPHVITSAINSTIIDIFNRHSNHEALELDSSRNGATDVRCWIKNKGQQVNNLDQGQCCLLGWVIDWVVVLHPTQHKIGHYEYVPQPNVVAWYGKTKPTTTKAHIHQSKEMDCNTK